MLLASCFGSEGKGKIIEHIASDYDIMVRTGAPNAGHSVWLPSAISRFAFQQIPCGAITNKRAILVIGAGGLILKNVLQREIEKLKECGVWGDRLIIDRQAGIIDHKHVLEEHGGTICPDHLDPMNCKEWKEQLNPYGKSCGDCVQMTKDDLWKKIGSTREGCGAALSARVWRKGNITLVKDDQEMMDLADSGVFRIMDTSVWLNEQIDHQARILLEGTQGSGLSVFHGYYPYTTSRDTNAANWLAEAGLSPKVVRSVIGVMRTFPIRVAGNSGPSSSKELEWNDIEKFAGAPEGSIKEKTTVTKRIRRVFEFNYDDVRKALLINRPDSVAITFVDYLNWNDRGKTTIKDLSEKSLKWIESLGEELRITDRIHFLSTGARPEEMITDAHMKLIKIGG